MFGLFNNKANNVPIVCGERARELVTAGATIIDVRSPGEFASGHLDGAINIPLQHIETRVTDLCDPGKTALLYCRSGMRSARAGGHLKRLGYSNVYDLGAMSKW